MGLPAVMSFTATSTGSTIATTAAVGTTCTVSADSLSLLLQCAARVLASPCRVMVEVIPLVHTGSLWGALPMKGTTPFISYSTKRTLGVSACSLLVQLLLRICYNNYNYFQFKLKGKGRSASGSDPWQLFVD